MLTDLVGKTNFVVWGGSLGWFAGCEKLEEICSVFRWMSSLSIKNWDLETPFWFGFISLLLVHVPDFRWVTSFVGESGHFLRLASHLPHESAIEDGTNQVRQGLSASQCDTLRGSDSGIDLSKSQKTYNLTIHKANEGWTSMTTGHFFCKLGYILSIVICWTWIICCSDGQSKWIPSGWPKETLVTVHVHQKDLFLEVWKKATGGRASSWPVGDDTLDGEMKLRNL